MWITQGWKPQENKVDNLTQTVLDAEEIIHQFDHYWITKLLGGGHCPSLVADVKKFNHSFLALLVMWLCCLFFLCCQTETSRFKRRHLWVGGGGGGRKDEANFLVGLFCFFKDILYVINSKMLLMKELPPTDLPQTLCILCSTNLTKDFHMAWIITVPFNVGTETEKGG